MANIDINTTEFLKRIERKQKKLDDRTLTNKKAVILLDNWIQKNFQSEGELAYPGKGWEPLDPKTIKARRTGTNKGRSDKILQDTGQLRGRWKHTWTQRAAKIQSGVEYGEYHEKGRGVPERRVLPTEEQIMPALLKLFGRFVRTSLK